MSYMFSDLGGAKKSKGPKDFNKILKDLAGLTDKPIKKKTTKKSPTDFDKIIKDLAGLSVEPKKKTTTKKAPAKKTPAKKVEPVKKLSKWNNFVKKVVKDLAPVKLIVARDGAILKKWYGMEKDAFGKLTVKDKVTGAANEIARQRAIDGEGEYLPLSAIRRPETEESEFGKKSKQQEYFPSPLVSNNNNNNNPRTLASPYAAFYNDPVTAAEAKLEAERRYRELAEKQRRIRDFSEGLQQLNPRMVPF